LERKKREMGSHVAMLSSSRSKLNGQERMEKNEKRRGIRKLTPLKPRSQVKRHCERVVKSFRDD
jgi:hypothetical protein